jgi:hypothetical protein
MMRVNVTPSPATSHPRSSQEARASGHPPGAGRSPARGGAGAYAVGGPGSASQEARLDRPPAHTGPPCVELSSERLDALAEADQAAPGAGEGRVVLRGAVVLDPYGESTPGLDADHDANVRTWRVPERVGEALLNHAESQVRDRLGDPAAVALEAAGDVQPAAARASDYLVDK